MKEYKGNKKIQMLWLNNIMIGVNKSILDLFILSKLLWPKMTEMIKHGAVRVPRYHFPNNEAKNKKSRWIVPYNKLINLMMMCV